MQARLGWARSVKISPFSDLLSHSRYFLTIRSAEGVYHSLILFRLSTSADNRTPTDDESSDDATQAVSSQETQYDQLYAMESTCPHLGAEMSHADIEECDTGLIAVCPWHRYDFDLRTGKSETGIHTCAYRVGVRLYPVPTVFLDPPRDGTGWRLVELRPVSEEFADPPPAVPPQVSLPSIGTVCQAEDEPVVPVEDPPTTLMEWAVLILNTPNPTLKVQRTRRAVHEFRTGKLKSIGHKVKNCPRPPDVPRRDDDFLKHTLAPNKMKGRRSKAAMLHALANIEQWAWDIMVRFGPLHQDIPTTFFSDFTKMALDESKHFTLLTLRLSAISPTTPYGSFPVHAGLWESATITAKSLRSRLAIIHLVHEARGLDVNPVTIERFRKAGDMESVRAMEVIHADEVTHVTSGHRWFTWLCERQGGLDPVATFREEVRRGWRGDVKGPFNVDDRGKAGLTQDFYGDLRVRKMSNHKLCKESNSLLRLGYDILHNPQNSIGVDAHI
ncbi:DUF455-domain-containing protein [Fistulina hepatica ATCC 64428]|uniref:DUF455-domain-containing protein n=1 Tax=Fistulina hepatica ATCC 64428 TaxID=1128425 RepID=A0A0D7A1F3_9AGAR|nr:DUF455-domain-containing protein [Fistulina hepatica ATCC 64428]